MHIDEMIGKRLGDLKLLEIIGAGGQGKVYKALDTKHRRHVAVKILPYELTLNEKNLKYFEREARLASSLDHPNICVILDLDEIDGVHFITMQYVEGRNLRQLVAAGPLDLKSALLIGIQVADALANAHRRGIIHRDIKSGNVMVTSSGQVKLLDFGLAKLLDESEAAMSGSHLTELTELGVPYGTAAYAAPEQALGERVDRRVDIFSTGVLLYEMLTGTCPFRGKTRIDIRYAVLHDTPESLTSIRASLVNPALQLIVDRSLAKNADDRYQDMEELRDALRSALKNIQTTARLPRYSITNLLSRTTYWLKSIPRMLPISSPTMATNNKHTSAPFTDRGNKRLAILPFRNLSNDPAVDFYKFFFADGIMTELARVRSLVIVPYWQAAGFQDENIEPLDVGRELNVNVVLTAGFIYVGGRFRVTAQLLDVTSGDILWSDRIDAAAADIIAWQDTIARQIVESLRLE